MFRSSGFRFLSALLLLVSLLASAGLAPAESVPVSVRYISLQGEIDDWIFPYSDDLFREPPEVYSHELAKASLGLTAAAFRFTREPLGAQQQNIVSWFEQADFSEIGVYGYDEAPGSDTVSFAIGEKQLEGSTLIAVGVCGSGYGNEWMSNFKIGTGVLHQGFQEAATQVEKQILERAERLNTPVRLWITGFSRAAAVSNVTAAQLTDSGVFEAVYAYTFATPRTTRDKGEYGNIFNILGACDIVPMIPFADWGFERFGTDLYTPAQETRADYSALFARADTVHRSIHGNAFHNAPEINNRLRLLLDHLYGFLPTQKEYASILQEPHREAWGSRDATTVSELAISVLDSLDLENAAQQAKAEALVEYLQMLTLDYLGDNTAGWNASVGMVGNLAVEHSINTLSQLALFRGRLGRTV